MKSLKLRVGIFGAEPWNNAMRDEIEKRSTSPPWIYSVYPK